MGEKGRVGLVVHVIAAWGQLPLMVAEEAVCKNLKPAISESNFGDMAMRGQDLYACQLNEHGQVEVWSMDACSHD